MDSRSVDIPIADIDSDGSSKSERSSQAPATTTHTVLELEAHLNKALVEVRQLHPNLGTRSTS